MSLIKTEKGKDALQRRDPDINPRERQLMILANGTRSVAAMGEMVGRSVDADIARLLEAGYLQEEVAVAKVPQPVAVPPVAPPPAAIQSQPKSTSRRSLAGTKMYMVDMLQLMRDMDASAMAVSIHTSDGEMEFMHNVIVAARLIAKKNGPSYGARIIEKLREIVPESHVVAVDALALELEITTIVA